MAATVLCPHSTHAYPTSVIYAPNGEALGLGSFAFGAYAGMAVSPDIAFGSGWGGIDFGILPSFDIAQTSAGTIGFAGAELGFDVFGLDEIGNVSLVFNIKLQLLQETTYLPAIAVGFFQVSPDPRRGAALGYFALSKSFSVGKIELGQLTFGMMRSFAPDNIVSPACLAPGQEPCVFQGAIPFVDQNGALILGYLSPWIGPIGIGIDHVGGTSAVSSTNVSVNVRLWHNDEGGFGAVGVGGFFSNDRRDSPPGPGAQDGLFVQGIFSTSLSSIFGPLSDDPKKIEKKTRRRDYDDLLDAPPIEPPKPTKTKDDEEDPL